MSFFLVLVITDIVFNNALFLDPIIVVRQLQK